MHFSATFFPQTAVTCGSTIGPAKAPHSPGVTSSLSFPFYSYVTLQNVALEKEHYFNRTFLLLADVQKHYQSSPRVPKGSWED